MERHRGGPRRVSNRICRDCINREIAALERCRIHGIRHVQDEVSWLSGDYGVAGWSGADHAQPR